MHGGGHERSVGEERANNMTPKSKSGEATVLAEERLGDRLVAKGLATRATIEKAAEEGIRTRQRIGEILIAAGEIEERELYRELAELRGIRYAEAEEVLAVMEPGLLETISRRFQERRRILPVARQGDSLLVATCDLAAPANELAHALGMKRTEIWLVTPTSYRRLRSAIDLGQVRTTEASAAGTSPRGRELGLENAPTIDSELVSLFDALLLDAIGERASDIHLERYGSRVRVRLRIDGDLHDLQRYRMTPTQLIGVINVLKVNSQLDIAERRLPQGGRFSASVGGKSYDLRVQTQPSLHGEHAVLRLLPQETQVLSIEDLGFPGDLAARYRRLLASPAGLLLVVGPTGAGKSTTLYAGLQHLARDTRRKVLSVEDPIEYAIHGVQQTQAHSEIGFDFAQAMRVFVRQDPDVILVGEIRDQETALEAIRASQTGHLVLSTLHCNDTVDAIQRLIDLGMHPNSIASELRAVFAQRLAKRICSHCRVPATPDEDLLDEVFPDGPPKGFKSFKGKGCDRCGGFGTRGRIAVIEHLEANSAIRRGVAQRLPTDDLRAFALEAGLRPMREQALDLVAGGLIELAELPHFLPPEKLAPERLLKIAAPHKRRAAKSAKSEAPAATPSTSDR